jgi:hypothetical protein
MADVIPLPTAAPAPPSRTRWRGRYPPVVTRMESARAKRALEQRRARLQKLEDEIDSCRREIGGSTTADALLELSNSARRGEVFGVVLAWEDAAGEQTAMICAEFEADRSRALDAAERLCGAIDSLER